MRDTWFVLLNPAAGNGKAAKNWNALSHAFEAHGLSFQQVTTNAPGHATSLIANAVKNGFHKFLSVGGDGTHHEVVNGLMQVKDETNKPLLAIYNAGTGNDWSRMHKIPGDVNAYMKMLEQNKTMLHSVGKITYQLNGQTLERYFINVAGMALDGKVLENFPAYLKRIPILPGYLVEGLRQLFLYHTPSAILQYDDQSMHGRFVTIHAGLSKYSGGGMQFVPHADPLDDQLAITCIGHMNKLRLLMNLPRVYLGTLLKHPKVKSFKCRTLSVVSKEEPIPIEADGEFLGYSPVNITILPKAFRLLTNF